MSYGFRAIKTCSSGSGSGYTKLALTQPNVVKSEKLRDKPLYFSLALARELISMFKCFSSLNCFEER